MRAMHVLVNLINSVLLIVAIVFLALLIIRIIKKKKGKAVAAVIMSICIVFMFLVTTITNDISYAEFGVSYAANGKYDLAVSDFKKATFVPGAKKSYELIEAVLNGDNAETIISDVENYLKQKSLLTKKHIMGMICQKINTTEDAEVALGLLGGFYEDLPGFFELTSTLRHLNIRI